MIRRAAIGVAVLAMSTGVAGCGGHHVTDADRLRADMARTAVLSHRFIYSDVAGKTRTEVKGLVADDFRYKASTTLNDVPIWEEVVNDDPRRPGPQQRRLRRVQPAGGQWSRRSECNGADVAVVDHRRAGGGDRR